MTLTLPLTLTLTRTQTRSIASAPLSTRSASSSSRSPSRSSSPAPRSAPPPTRPPTLTPTLTLTPTPRHALPLLPTLPLGSLANLSVRLDALNLSGLDRLSSMQLLQPVAGAHGQAAAPSSLASRLALERASLSLGLNLTVTPTQAALHAPPLTESFQVTLDVREASAAVLLLLAVNGSALRRLSAADLRPPACLLAPILEAGVRGLFRGISINYIRVVPMVAVSFTSYDLLKDCLGVSGANKPQA